MYPKGFAGRKGVVGLGKRKERGENGREDRGRKRGGGDTRGKGATWRI